NHCPDGTAVNWRVMQSHKPVAVGSFVGVGGGSTNHFETMPLGVKLTGRDSEPDGADVQFDWNINGVPFRYSVRRDPNCWPLARRSACRQVMGDLYVFAQPWAEMPMEE